MSGSGQTTVTGDRTSRTASGAEVAAVAWTHPQLAMSMLRDLPVVVGRSDDCTTKLLGARVSRRHAEFVRGDHGWLVRDLGSKNGTLLNGSRVSLAPLSNHDVLRVGEWVGVVMQVPADFRGDPVTTVARDVLCGPALAATYTKLSAIASSDLAVVLTGETGTGKEVFAQALHQQSGREGGLVAVNCAALPEQMAEGELFGYRKGAFTSAVRGSLGYLRSAHRGTLFLDEVVELGERVQAKLLRALETKSIVPLGEALPEAVDLRVIAAAQSPLADLVEAGRFRADLYSRLAGVELVIPPLRQRREEVLPHFRRVLTARSGGAPPDIEAEAAEKLCLYDWPLNVRGVQQVAARIAVLLGHEDLITVAHLPECIAQPKLEDLNHEAPKQRRAKPSRAAQRLQQSERRNQDDTERLIAALRLAGGNVTAAARTLGISRQRAYRLMDQNPEIDVSSFGLSDSKTP